MKKIVSYALVVALVITMVLCLGTTVALADGGIVASINVDPPALTGPGNVSLKITLKNNGDALTNVRIVYPDSGETVSVGDLGAGETKEHTNTNWYISEDMLDKDLVFTIEWVEADGTQKSGTTKAVRITKEEAVVKVDGAASVDKSEGKAGDVVKFNFSMSNTGTVKIDNAYLNAPPIAGGSQIGSNFSLDPGSTQRFSYDYTLTASETVKPVFTYSVNGEERKLELDSISLNVTEAPKTVTMTANLRADKTEVNSGEDVNFTITVNNTGTSQLDGLIVKDFNGNNVTMNPTSIPAGGSSTGTATLPVTATNSYMFTVAAVGAGGQSVNINSNVVQITVADTPVDVDPNQIFETRIGISNMQLSEPGVVTIQAVVTNKSDYELKNITVQDAVLGTIGSADTLASMQNVTFEKTFDIKETGEYIFKTTAELPDGTVVETETQPATITVAEDTGMPTWLIGVIAIGVIVAALAIFLGVYFSKQKKKKKLAAEGKAEPGAYGGPSPTGRPKPQHYGQPPAAETTGQPERPSTAQQQNYQRRRAVQVETVEPDTIKPPPGTKNNVKFGDRNKF